MRLILLSGGAGKRLWPLSNASRPKQFLPVLQHEGKLESMLQRVCRQLLKIGLTEPPLFSASHGQHGIIQGQIGTEGTILEEPERRDTFPAICLSAAYLSSKEECGPDELIGVMPVDGYAEDAFYRAFSELPGVMERTGAEIALMGVTPDSPSDKYGYIVPHLPGEEDGSCRVRSFAEKPTVVQAQKLLNEGALWNCGVFVFRLGYLLKEMEKRKLPVKYDELLGMYNQIPRISFDIEVLEQAENIVAVPFRGRWKDIGTWNSLSEEMENSVSGSGYICPASHQSRIINELEIPVSIWSVPNIVVAAGPDGILVTDRDASTGIKDMVEHVEISPRREEKWWGTLTVLMCRQQDGTESVTNRVVILKDRYLSYHEHAWRKEVWTVVAGIGEVCMNGRRFPVEAGAVIVIEAGMKHSILAYSDLELIESQIGRQIVSDDRIRYDNPWTVEHNLQQIEP